MKNSLYFDYLKIKNQNRLSPETLKDFFIRGVKNGDINFARELLRFADAQNMLSPLIHDDPELLLYQGRLLSQEQNFSRFFAFYDEKKNHLLKSAKLPEGLLSLDWRMAVNKVIDNDISESKRYFEIHKKEATVSQHELAHSFQCQGGVLILDSSCRKQGISFLYSALSIYFEVFQRDETYYNIIDNIRCIVVNLLLQGVFEYIEGQYGLSYKKFTFCKIWFSEAGIPKTASGIAELSSLIEIYDSRITEFVFGTSYPSFQSDDITRGICEGREIAKMCISNSKKFDIGCIREACVLLNEPLDNKKYVLMGDIIMQTKKVFIVEGRNDNINRSMFDFLCSLGLEPIEWEQARNATGQATPFIGDILDCAFKMAQAIVVLLTPDEETVLCESLRTEDGDEAQRFQPRPNVIFEAGIAMAINPHRTILVSFGDAYVWTDISGRHLIKMDNTFEKRQALCSRLRTAGCIFDTNEKTKWYSTGDFDVKK